MKKIIVSFVFALVLGVSAVPASALTVAEQIAQLQAQIATLQAQLAALQNKPIDSASWCHDFNTNLGVGSSGVEVAALAQVLSRESLGLDYNTGMNSIPSYSYDEKVASAVSAFQQKYASEILSPLGLRYGTGYVGRSTRAKLNKLYGCGYVNGSGVVISGVSGPTSLSVGQTGTWSVSAKDSLAGTLSYSVNWGDDSQVVGGMTAMMNPPKLFTQESSFTHSYSIAGNYKVTFTVQNSTGQSAQSSITVNVGASSDGTITVISPNGGEIWYRGNTNRISWVASGGPVDINLVPYYPPCTGTVCPMYAYRAPYTLAKSVTGSYFDWQGQAWAPMGAMPVYITDGQYTVEVCKADSSICDSSDAPFRFQTIYTAQ